MHVFSEVFSAVYSHVSVKQNLPFCGWIVSGFPTLVPCCHTAAAGNVILITQEIFFLLGSIDGQGGDPASPSPFQKLKWPQQGLIYITLDWYMLEILHILLQIYIHYSLSGAVSASERWGRHPPSRMLQFQVKKHSLWSLKLHSLQLLCECRECKLSPRNPKPLTENIISNLDLSSRRTKNILFLFV